MIGQSVITGGNALPNVTETGPGTTTAASAITISGTLQVIQGEFASGSQNVIVNGLATISGGEYAASTASDTFNGGLTLSGRRSAFSRAIQAQ